MWKNAKTQGLVMTYNGKLIDASFFPISKGYTEKLVKLGAEVIATDISTEMVAPYSKTCWKQGKGAEFRP